MRKGLRPGIETLVLQEIRFLKVGQTFTPGIIINEIMRSIQDAKKGIVRLTRAMGHQERTTLLKKMFEQAVDKEIDRLIESRKCKCLRCIHGRFYDRSGTAYPHLPVGTIQVHAVGCERSRSGPPKTCRRFVEIWTAYSLKDYLIEISLLYEFRESISGTEEIWKEYFLR